MKNNEICDEQGNLMSMCDWVRAVTASNRIKLNLPVTDEERRLAEELENSYSDIESEAVN